MAWIKVDPNLHRKPEVIRIAAILKKDRRLVAACCVIFWGWSQESSVDGFIAGADAEMIDTEVNLEGFSNALASVGWLELAKDGVMIPNWERHNSEGAKQRAMTAQRVAKHKNQSQNDTGNAKGNGKTNASGNAESNAKGNAVTVTKTLGRGEERRGEETEREERREEQREGKRENAEKPSTPLEVSSDVSLSDSPESEREITKTKWTARASVLFNQGDPKQRRADATDAERFFDEIWPEDLDRAEGARRAHVARNIAARTFKGITGSRLAYAKTVIRSELNLNGTHK